MNYQISYYCAKLSNCGCEIPGRFDASTTDIRSSKHPINKEEATALPSADQEKCNFSCWMDINLNELNETA